MDGEGKVSKMNGGGGGGVRRGSGGEASVEGNGTTTKAMTTMRRRRRHRRGEGGGGGGGGENDDEDDEDDDDEMEDDNDEDYADPGHDEDAKNYDYQPSSAPPRLRTSSESSSYAAEGGRKRHRNERDRETGFGLGIMAYLAEELGPRDKNLVDGSDARKDEQLIYNTIFKVPYEVERVLSLGSILGVDAVIAALTLLPVKTSLCLWELLTQSPPTSTPLASDSGTDTGKVRTGRRLTADDLSNLAWLATLAAVSYALTRFDVSFIYHFIRSQDTLKLYVVFNILDIMDKLFLSFNTDTFEAMALRACTCTDPKLTLTSRIVESMLLFRNWLVSTVSIFVHGSVILCQAVTLNVALNTSSKGLLPLLVSNQFMEVKGFVFKRMDYKRLFNITCQDIAERVNIIVMVLFVIIHSALGGKGKRNAALISAALYNKLVVVILCEFVVDWMKHAFLSKFNSLPSTTYRRFLGDISKSRRETSSLYTNKVVSFVPLAHAAVCVRLLTSVHRAFPLRSYPLHWVAGTLILFIAKIVFGIIIKVRYTTTPATQFVQICFPSRTWMRRMRLHICSFVRVCVIWGGRGESSYACAYVQGLNLTIYRHDLKVLAQRKLRLG